MGGPYSGGVSGRRGRSHGENGRHTPESDRSAECRRSPSYDSYDRREPDRRGRSPGPSYDRYDEMTENEDQPPAKRRLLSAVVKVEDGEIIEDAEAAKDVKTRDSLVEGDVVANQIDGQTGRGLSSEEAHQL